MVTKKSDSTKKEKPAASRKKKTAEIVEEVSQASEELNQSLALVQSDQEQPQENEIVQEVLHPTSLFAASTASSDSTSTATQKTTKKKKESVMQRDERFDLNMILLAGIIHSVWGSGSD